VCLLDPVLLLFFKSLPRSPCGSAGSLQCGETAYTGEKKRVPFQVSDKQTAHSGF
jgi:hypothetical protein